MVYSKSQYIFVATLLLSGAVALLSMCSKNEVPAMEGMVYIPAGKFMIGSRDVDNNDLAKEFGSKQKTFFENEKPVRKIYLKGFYIDKFEVTNKGYKLFVLKAGYRPPTHWRNVIYISTREDHPVFNVSWFDANAYCAFMGKRLPTEEEWEKAARGPNGNRYPWGDEYDEEKANLNKKDTVMVGSMPEDKSYYGVYDMGGNLMEWTNSWYKPYPGSTFQLKEYGEKYRVVRGSTGNYIGHYHLAKIYSRSSYRFFGRHNQKGFDIGFRCAKERE